MKEISFGLKNGKIVSVDDVSKGIECNCTCPSCNSKLVAVKGDKNRHHFRHENSNNCNETVLHIVAKQIFEKYKNIVLPAVFLDRKNEFNKRIKFLGKRNIRYHKVELEKIEGNIIADIKITDETESFYIEIAVTHRIDKNKYESLKKNQISTIEINLSKLYKRLTTDKLQLSIQLFEDYIINYINNKIWIYSKEKENFIDFMTENYCVIKNCTEHLYEDPLIFEEDKKKFRKAKLLHETWYSVDNCPIEKGIWSGGNKKGDSFANVKKHCSNCVYCTKIEYSHKSHYKIKGSYNYPKKIYCIWQENFQELILEFTKYINTDHGNKKIKIIKKEYEQKKLF